ncbi:hypothetical protein VTK26DRAFT_3848 [Humicola hyalothermophila]
MVTTLANAPDAAPATKLSAKVSAWFSPPCEWCRSRASFALSRRPVSRPRIVSYPHQYMPEKGTSRHSVSVRPRHSARYPCAATISWTPRNVSARCPPLLWGPSAPAAAAAAAVLPDAACRRVRNSSIGLTAVAASTRAAEPAISGAYSSEKRSGLAGLKRSQS